VDHPGNLLKKHEGVFLSNNSLPATTSPEWVIRDRKNVLATNFIYFPPKREYLGTGTGTGTGLGTGTGTGLGTGTGKRSRDDTEAFEKRPRMEWGGEFRARPEEYRARPEEYRARPEEYRARPEEFRARPEENEERHRYYRESSRREPESSSREPESSRREPEYEDIDDRFQVQEDGEIRYPDEIVSGPVPVPVPGPGPVQVPESQGFNTDLFDFEFS